jgi:uncharacterized membrane protein
VVPPATHRQNYVPLHEQRINGGLLWRNLALLGAMSVIPFPTAVVSSTFQLRSHGDERTALILYGIVGVASAATWLLLFHFLSRSPGLLEREAHATFFAGERHRAGWRLWMPEAPSPPSPADGP